MLTGKHACFYVKQYMICINKLELVDCFILGDIIV